MLADIDRHILSELAGNNVEIAKWIASMDQSYKKIIALHERNTALICHLVGVIKEADTKNGTEKKGNKKRRMT